MGYSSRRRVRLEACICLRQTYKCPPLFTWSCVGWSILYPTIPVLSWAAASCCCMSCKPLGTRRCRSHMFVNLKVVWRTARYTSIRIHIWCMKSRIEPLKHVLRTRAWFWFCSYSFAYTCLSFDHSIGDPLGTPYKRYTKCTSVSNNLNIYVR
jgi:hypothetical protein